MIDIPILSVMIANYFIKDKIPCELEQVVDKTTKYLLKNEYYIPHNILQLFCEVVFLRMLVITAEIEYSIHKNDLYDFKDKQNKFKVKIEEE